LDSQLVNIRRAMPFDIAPRLRRSKFDYLSVPDRDALKAFLETPFDGGRHAGRVTKLG
jgi:hypothetical protein